MSDSLSSPSSGVKCQMQHQLSQPRDIVLQPVFFGRAQKNRRGVIVDGRKRTEDIFNSSFFFLLLQSEGKEDTSRLPYMSAETT